DRSSRSCCTWLYSHVVSLCLNSGSNWLGNFEGGDFISSKSGRRLPSRISLIATRKPAANRKKTTPKWLARKIRRLNAAPQMIGYHRSEKNLQWRYASRLDFGCVLNSEA